MSVRVQSVAIGAALITAQWCLAQTVSGRVTGADGGPAGGVMVTAIDDHGAGVARVLGTEAGVYSLRLPRAGTYRIRAIRLGFQPAVSAAIYIALDESNQVDLVMVPVALALDSVSVADRSDCDLRGADAQLFLQLWERARDALAAAQLLEHGRFEIWTVGEFGHADRDGKNARGDSAIVRQSAAGAALTTTAGMERTLAAGYVRRGVDGHEIYEAPTPDDLLSDAFMARHCFSIKGAPSTHRDWIGIGYAPVGDYSWVDIVGTIWLDRETGTLRRVDFRYTHLDIIDQLCGRLHDDGKEMCLRPHESNMDPAGGHVDFAALKSGAWLAIDREIRTSIDTVLWVKLQNNTSAPGLWVNSPSFRKSTIGWKVASVYRDGTEIYRDDRANNIVNRTVSSRAGRHPSALDGILMDTTGHPISGAVVKIVDLSRATITNDSGFFQIPMLPAEQLEVRMGCPGHPDAPQHVSLTRDSTRHLTLTLAIEGLLAATPALPLAQCKEP